jgi:hypothetical protein
VSSNQPDHRSSQINGTQKVGSAFVIARRNCSILLEFGEEVFNEMTGFIQVLVVSTGVSAVTLGRNHSA